MSDDLIVRGVRRKPEPRTIPPTPPRSDTETIIGTIRAMRPNAIQLWDDPECRWLTIGDKQLESPLLDAAFAKQPIIATVVKNVITHIQPKETTPCTPS